MKKLFLCFALIPLLVACDSQQVAESTAVDDANVAEATSNEGSNSADHNESTESAVAQQSAGEQIAQMTGEFETKMDEFRTAMENAADDDERRKLFNEMYPNPQEYAGKLMELARKNPDDPNAVDALAFVATNTRGGADQKEAMDTLLEKHADSDKLAEVCTIFMFSRDPNASSHLESLMEKSPHDSVKATATFVLASMLKNKSEMDNTITEDQFLPLFKSVVNNYSDTEIRGMNLAEMAAGEIFAIENLAIGKEAPEIEGEDLDGVAFKLSDYRGKVIMLDFWGDW